MVLYFVAVGGVQGFAFTLGLTTLIDIVVVFFFTKPLVTLLVADRSSSGKATSGPGSIPGTSVPSPRRPAGGAAGQDGCPWAPPPGGRPDVAAWVASGTTLPRRGLLRLRRPQAGSGTPSRGLILLVADRLRWCSAV